MRIAHISDLHIAPENTFAYDVDTRKNFLLVLKDVLDWNPDCIVITGDLLFRDDDMEAYTWIKEKLHTIKAPVFIIPGNHDNVKTLNTLFSPEREVRDKKAGCFSSNVLLKEIGAQHEMAYILSFDELEIIFLDSSSACVSKEQLSDLTDHIIEDGYKQRIIFIHHPPILSGHVYLDREWPLLNISEVKPVIKRISKASSSLTIFCGHYHYEDLIKTDHFVMHVTPSTFIQIDPAYSEFKKLNVNTGWRKIEVNPSGIESQVVWQN